MNKPILQCRDLSKTFDEGGLHVEVFNKINLAIYPQELVAIVGASGAGKSTLLHLLGGLERPTSGEVWVAEQPLSRLSAAQQGKLRNHYLGFVYQFHHLLPEFNALENVAMPLLIGNLPPAVARERASSLLDKVGLKHRKKHRIGELSGGERQRVAIARALVTKPLCVLADEPTGNLDQHTAAQIIDLMLQLNAELHTSFVIVTHDLNLARRLQKILTL